jgi:hypothetical protein
MPQGGIVKMGSRWILLLFDLPRVLLCRKINTARRKVLTPILPLHSYRHEIAPFLTHSFNR